MGDAGGSEGRRPVPGEEARGMTVMGVSKFERFFRAAAGLDVDNRLL
ncbi:hypothetical protein [Streptomyces sp. NPDC046978]